MYYEVVVEHTQGRIWARTLRSYWFHIITCAITILKTGSTLMFDDILAEINRT